MDRAKSISAAELNKVAASAARSVLGSDIKRFAGGGPGTPVGYFPEWRTIGIWIPERELESMRVSEVYGVATKIAGEMRSVAGEAKVTVHIGPGGATAGYFPVDPIIAEHLS